MISRLITILCFTLGFAGAQETAGLRALLPSGAFVFVEADDLADVVKIAHESGAFEAIEASALYQEFKDSEPYQKAIAGKALAEHVLRMDLWEAGERLLDGHIGVGLYPKDASKEPNVVVLVRPADGEAWENQHQWIRPLLRLAGKRLPAEQGIEAYEFKPDKKASLYAALHEAWVLFGTDSKLLEKTIALQGGTEPEITTLAEHAAFERMAALTKEDSPHIRALIDTAMIKKGLGERLGIPEKLDNPLGSLVAGGIAELIANSSTAAITLDVTAQGFVLDTRLDSNPGRLDPRFQVFFCKHPESGIERLPSVPNMIGGFTFYRQIGEWYRNRDQFMQDQVLPGFDKFETGIGNILPGKDFGEDVMPLIGDNITFVSAVQDYAHLDGELGIKLPAFAAIVDLAQPEEGEAVFKLFVQTLLSVLNFEAAKQQRQPWLVDAKVHNGVSITTARYLENPKGDDLPIVFNFLPAAARVGDQYIVSSSLSLCQKLIDRLQSPSDANEKLNRNFGFHLEMNPLIDVLKANESHLQAKRIVEGRSVEQAQGDIAIALTLLSGFKHLGASTSATSDGFTLRLHGAFNDLH